MLGIAQPSVSGWSRVPSERVMAVEAATGVSRNTLRPDLYAAPLTATDGPVLDDIDLARGRTYRLFAHVLSKPPSQVLLDQIAAITGDATPLGMAWIALADAARATTETEAGEEYFKVLIGVGRGEVLAYASYYMAGFLHERPLAAVRADFARLGIERRTGSHEPEDSAATLFDAMAGLIDGTTPAGLAAQDAFFEAHLKPWTPRLFADLIVAPSAKFYRAVGDVGRHWIDLETRALAIAA